MPRLECCVSFKAEGEGVYQAPNGNATSVFAAAATALEWFRDWKGPFPGPDEILEVKISSPSYTGKRIHRVRVGRVLEWMKERKANAD